MGGHAVQFGNWSTGTFLRSRSNPKVIVKWPHETQEDLELMFD